MDETGAVFPLAVELETEQNAELVGRQDPQTRALLARLQRVIPHRGIRQAATRLGMSTSHLNRALADKTDVGPEFRAKILDYVTEREAHTDATKRATEAQSELDLSRQKPDTVSAPDVTTPVTAPPHNLPSEVKTMPTPSHAAICELLSYLPAPIILRMIPDVAKKVEDYLGHTDNPTDEPPPASPHPSRKGR